MNYLIKPLRPSPRQHSGLLLISKKWMLVVKRTKTPIRKKKSSSPLKKNIRQSRLTVSQTQKVTLSLPVGTRVKPKAIIVTNSQRKQPPVPQPLV